MMPHPWKPGFADANATRHGHTARAFLSKIVQPAIAQLEQQRQDLAASSDPVVKSFELYDHMQLIAKANIAFCLAIQSLFEQQIRNYLITLIHDLQVVDVSVNRIEKAAWGTEFDGLFLKVRGLHLRSFETYQDLTLLSQLGNVCRHGNGNTARALFRTNRELWPEQPPSPWAQPNVDAPQHAEHIQITLVLLTRLVNAVDVFWTDIQLHALGSLGLHNPDIAMQVERLQQHKKSLY